MNWLEGLVWVAITVPIAALVHRGLHARDSGITPLGVLYVVWIFATFLYVANPFHLQRLPTRGTMALISAAVSFTVGYGIVLLGSRRGATKVREGAALELRSSHAARQLGAFARTWRFCLITWGLLLAVYLTQIRAYSGAGLHVLLYSLRTSLGYNDSPPSGFYYFYFAQIVVPFGAILRIRTGRRMYLVWSLAALFSLVLTSGRTNIIIAIMSWAFVAILAGGHKFDRRRIANIAFVSLCVLFTFAFLGDTIGKTYDNSELYATYGDSPPVPGSLVQPLFYVNGPISYFGQLTESPGGQDRGSNLGRPFLQVASVIDPSISPDNKIQTFLSIPFQTNLGTYLSPIWRDFGLVGIVLMNAILGALAAIAWVLWRRRRTPGTLAITAVTMVFCASSILDASYAELWFVLYLVVVAVSSRARKRPAHLRDHLLTPVANEY